MRKAETELHSSTTSGNGMHKFVSFTNDESGKQNSETESQKIGNVCGFISY